MTVDYSTDWRNIVSRHARKEGNNPTPLAALKLSRISEQSSPECFIQKPALTLIVQGRKEVKVGRNTVPFDETQYCLISIDTPITARILGDPHTRAYLGLSVTLEPEILNEVLVASRSREQVESTQGTTFGRLEGPLVQAIDRLLGLLDRPGDIPFLGPLVLREIYYYLLTGETGSALRSIARTDGRLRRVARAVSKIKDDYASPLKIDELAREVNMSPSWFIRQFRNATSLSPLQYQKQIRLHEARRLLLVNGFGAAEAAFQVGYESPTQFNREYRRLFGESPGSQRKAMNGQGQRRENRHNQRQGQM
jgi:AraC-like DNA-binding protein